MGAQARQEHPAEGRGAPLLLREQERLQGATEGQSRLLVEKGPEIPVVNELVSKNKPTGREANAPKAQTNAM